MGNEGEIGRPVEIVIDFPAKEWFSGPFFVGKPITQIILFSPINPGKSVSQLYWPLFHCLLFFIISNKIMN